jgi:hypothetical protein
MEEGRRTAASIPVAVASITVVLTFFVSASNHSSLLMKKLILLIAVLFGSYSYANEASDTFRAGLLAFQANGPDALLNAWYGEDSEVKQLPELRARLTALSARLGPVVETEVFDPRMLGKRVTRLYGVIYFRKRPLWIRADYYTADGASGFIALDFSTKPEEILPLEVAVAGK